MTTPLVSITSAFHNEESYLLDVIKSVFAQTFTDWELILIDDGSTDNSLQVAQSVDDPRLKVYSNGSNLGRSASLNKLNFLARGKYIARFDADDMCSKTRIEKQVDFMESHSEVDIVGTGVCYLDNDDIVVGHYSPPPSHNQICRQPTRMLWILHGTILGKKEWFQKNAYDESLSISVDYNLFFRTYKHSIFANIPEPLYYYRLDQSFNLKKQLKARYSSAKFLFENQKKNGHYFKACFDWLTQYAKFIATVLMFATGVRGRLMARRYNNISEDDQKRYIEELSHIKNIELPIRPKNKK